MMMTKSVLSNRAQPCAINPASRVKLSSSLTVVRASANDGSTHWCDSMVLRRAALAVSTAVLMGTAALEVQAGGPPKSTTAASMSSYTMEGTRHMGLSAERKAALLAKVRGNAETKSTMVTAKP